MSDGELKCCGSAFFLKKRFGIGYRLICEKGNGCNPDRVTQTLRPFVPSIGIDLNIGTELSYKLADEEKSKFPTLFRCLEEKRKELALSGFGVSVTTLEEVFLKVISESETSKSTIVDVNSNEEKQHINKPLCHGVQLEMNRWRALLKKRYLFWKKSWIIYLIQNILPYLFLALALFGSVLLSSNESSFPSLKISLGTYSSSTVLLEPLRSSSK